jgi:hypothetical protein
MISILVIVLVGLIWSDYVRRYREYHADPLNYSNEEPKAGGPAMLTILLIAMASLTW